MIFGAVSASLSIEALVSSAFCLIASDCLSTAAANAVICPFLISIVASFVAMSFLRRTISLEREFI